MIDNFLGADAPGAISAARRAHAVPGRPLSEAQQRVLVALVSLCPLTGQEAELAEVAEAAVMKPNAAKLALTALDDKAMARLEDDGRWWPTWDGRSRARGLAGV